MIVANSKESQLKVEYLAQTGWDLRGKNPLLAIKILYHAISIAETESQTYILPKLYNYLGVVYRNTGNYGFAQAYFTKAITNAQKSSNKTEEGFAYNNIGEILYLVGDYSTSFYYFNNAEKIFLDIDNKKGLGYVYNQIGLYYYELGNYRKSIDYLQKSLAIRLQTNDSINIAANYKNLINPYLKLNNLDSVAYLLVKLETLNKKLKLPRIQIDLNEAYANYYFKLNKPDKAIYYAKDALDEAQSIYYWKGVKNLSFLLYQYYYQTGDYQKATEYILLNQAAKDTLLNQSSLKDIYLFYNQYSTNKEIFYQSKISTYKFTLIILILFTFLSISILTFYLLNFKKRVKELDAKFIELENNLEDTINSYNDQLNNKDKYLSIIAHDLKNPISAIKNISEMMINENRKFSERELYDNLHLIKNTSNSLFNLLMDLLEWSRANTGQITVNPVMINTEKIVNEVITYLILQANNKQIKISVDIEPNTFIFADYNMVNTILRNIVSNAIKFTPISGNISISAHTNNDKTVIQISDNGLGIPPEKLSKLFTLEKSRSTVGTSGETGTGLGLILCKDFVEKNNGTISVFSELNKGTTFTITLPNNKN